MAGEMNVPHWHEMAILAMQQNRLRKIIKDSDGNPARTDYKAGAADAAANAASKAEAAAIAINSSHPHETALSTLLDTLERYEIPESSQ